MQGTAGIQLLVHEARAQPALAATPFREWNSRDGTVWTSFYRVDSGYLLRFPEWADFQVSTSGEQVDCWPCPTVNAHSLEHLFLNQVVPLVQSRRGKMMFHGSAVEINGKAIAFMGPTGRGKSTLAASFATSGFPFLTDDGLGLILLDGQIFATPSHPSIRLWQDSETALINEGAVRAPPVQYSSKSRVLADADIVFCPDACVLQTAYFIGDDPVDEPRFGLVTPSGTVEELMRNSFLLDIDEKQSLAAHFDELVALANRQVFYRLDYPRRYEDMAIIRHAIVEHAQISNRLD